MSNYDDSESSVDQLDRQSKVVELFTCVQYNKLDNLRSLVASGVDINCVQDGHTALSLAAQLGKLSAVNLLLESGRCQLSVSDGLWLQQQPLHHAARHDHGDVVERLLAVGAHVDDRDVDKRTPLHWAANSGNVHVVDLLVAHGATVDAVQRDGFTPLHIAVRRGDMLMCKRLLLAGANLNCPDGDGWTPLHMAAAYDYIDLVSLLLGKGAYVDQRNAEGQTPLFVAAERAGTSLLQRILRSVSGLRDRDETDTKPLLDSVELDCLGVVCYLLDAGADPNTRDRTDCSLIRLACTRSLSTLLGLIVAAGADLYSEEWLKILQNSPTVPSSNDDSSLVAWLREQVKQPRSLQMTARIFIRRRLMPYVQAKVALLPIPVTLQHYLSLQSGVDIYSNKAGCI